MLPQRRFAPHPHKRLKGSGKQVRNILIESVPVLEDPVVIELLEVAAARSGMRSGTGAGKIIIKSISAKQRPRRAGSQMGSRSI